MYAAENVPIQPCPICGRETPRFLEHPSKEAWVNYYRCDKCGHVWTMPKPQEKPSLEDRK
jgi:uncharacterized Zn finger protein